jgi:hypothetical protein
MSGKDRDELASRVTHRLLGLQWTIESDAIAFGLRSEDDAKQVTHFEIWLAPLDGARQELAHADFDQEQLGFGDKFILSRDRKFLVATSHWPRPLIWDLAANKPRATPFLALAPSSTSGRWIAIEKDTRQLVVLDENFAVAERYEEFLPSNSHGLDLDWSPDERYVIWRNQIGFDHTSNWEGSRLDLKTHQRRILTGAYMNETIAFTGRDGEFLRAGADGERRLIVGLHVTAAYIELVPEGDWYPQQLFRLFNAPGTPEEKAYQIAEKLPVFSSPDFNLFVVGIPRQGTELYGRIFHLMDRDSHIWRLPGEDSGTYSSPYEVIGFAENGKSIIAHDEKRLFTIPVDAIQTPENKVR